MWYVIAKHPEGEWEKRYPYATKEEAEASKQDVETFYGEVLKTGFCPVMEVVEGDSARPE